MIAHMRLPISNFYRHPLTLMLALLILTIVVSACIAPDFSANSAPTPTGPLLHMHTTGKGDRVDSSSHVSPGSDELTLDIYSERGIGSATLTFSHYYPDHVPDQITIHLHTKGLEHFQVATDEQVITASVPSSGNGQSIQSASTSSANVTQLQPITPNSPHWLTITQANDTPATQNGDYFAIVLPAQLLKQEVQTITLEWVDFYR